MKIEGIIKKVEKTKTKTKITVEGINEDKAVITLQKKLEKEPGDEITITLSFPQTKLK